MINIKELFEKYPETKITYINEIAKERWSEWKKWSNCSEEEKEKANLRQIFPNEIILDIENINDFEDFEKTLELDNIKYYAWKTGSRGVHISLYFENFDNLDIETRTYIRRKIITDYK